jgi:hypothetical protein
MKEMLVFQQDIILLCMKFISTEKQRRHSIIARAVLNWFRWNIYLPHATHSDWPLVESALLLICLTHISL